MRAFRGDRGLLSRPRMLSNGFMQSDAFFTRVGVFAYRNTDGSTRRELRLPEEVFKGDSLETFKMATVTLGHPPEPVTAKNARQYQVGTTGQDVRRDSDKMRGTIMVSDEAAIRAMKAGVREISNGYFCDLEMTPGVTKGIEGVEDGLSYDCIQRNIEGNHVAIVERGRAGPEVAARVDSVPERFRSLRCDDVDDIAFGEVRFDDDDQLHLDNPYEIEKSGDKFRVVKSSSGKVMGTHDSKEEAVAQLQALEAAENDDADNVSTAAAKRLRDILSADNAPLHMVGMLAWPISMEMGLTVTELAQALGVQENGVEPILSGEVMPTGAQLEGLADLLDIPAETLKDLLPEKQRALTDREDSTMEEFDININGVTFKLKGDSAARQAVTKELADKAEAVDSLKQEMAKKDSEHEEAIQAEKARADSAEEAKTKAEAERDAAQDPSTVRKRIDERLDLERTARDILGDDFDETKADADLRADCILKLQPTAQLEGKPDTYVQARFDAAVELFEQEQEHVDDAGGKGDPNRPTNRTRVVAAAAADKGDASARIDKARRDAAEKRRNMWRTPLSASKDSDPEKVTIRQ